MIKDATTLIEFPITPPITLPIKIALSEASVIASLIPVQPCSKSNNTLLALIPKASPIILPIWPTAAETARTGAKTILNAAPKASTVPAAT